MSTNRGVPASTLFAVTDIIIRKTKIYPHNLPNDLGLFANTSNEANRETFCLRIRLTAVYAEPVCYEQKDETRLAAVNLLKKDPESLFTEGMVIDYVGREMKASPYRLFLGSGDPWALKQVHDEIIPKIKDGEAKAKEEFNKQFPIECQLLSSNPTDDQNQVVKNDLYLYQENDEIWYATKTPRGIVRAKITKEEYENHFDLLTMLKKSDPEKEKIDDIAKAVLLDIASKRGDILPDRQWLLDPKYGEEALYDSRNRKQIARVIAQLQTIIAVITADPCTNGQATLPDTKAAVEELRQIFAPKKGEIIETGLNFPLKILKEIYKVYDAQFTPWSTEQLSFFSREVIGSAEAALTAVDGQSCKNGLNNLDMQKGPDRRDGLYCPKPVGIPKDKAPIRDKLGREIFVDPYDGYSVFLSSSPGAFDCYNKNGMCLATEAGPGACAAAGAAHVGQLMENKSRRLWELLCGHAKRSQHTVSITVSNR